MKKRCKHKKECNDKTCKQRFKQDEENAKVVNTKNRRHKTEKGTNEDTMEKTKTNK